MSAVDTLKVPALRRPARLWRAAAVDIERLLFAATLVAAMSLMFLAPRLPLTDLPQHAGQIALWRDLLAGHSAWANLVRVNLFTPYLIGYGLALPFAAVLPIAIAVKVVLCLALLSFVAGCMGLRRLFDGDRRLDWLFPASFFCCAFQWGFMTFLVASPVAFVFLIVAYRFSTQPTRRRGTWLTLTGVALLFSHGLLFVAMLPIGALLALWKWRQMRMPDILRVVSPFAVLCVICLAFRLISAQAEGAMRYDEVVFGPNLFLKGMAQLLFITSVDTGSTRIGLLLAAALMAAPFALGCRLRSGPAAAPMLGLIAITLALPSYAFQTAMLFHRFALFILPFYALLFEVPKPAARRGAAWAVAWPIAACWAVLALQAERIAAFATEARPFETVLDAAQPNARALSLIFDRESPAADNDTVYAHFPLWYEADKGGFVDFNFAEFHPQVVRFQAGKTPDYGKDWTWFPHRFVGTADHLRPYRYVFVRGSKDDVGNLVAQSACALSVVVTDHEWTLLERGVCTPR